MSRSPDFVTATIEETLAIADALERAAVARYSNLAEGMRRVGQPELAQVFESLAAEEKLHVDGVERLSESLLHASPHAELSHWALPETFGPEEAGPPALLTPYRALSIAVRAEARAFAFWAYVASEAGNQIVRDQAEAMARQELVHAAKLRHARRRAYHAEHPGRARNNEEAAAPHTLPAIRGELRRKIGEAAGLMLGAARRLERVPDRESARLLCDIAEEMRALSGPPAAQSGPDELAWRIDRAASVGSAGILFEATGVLERCAERCLAMLDTSGDAIVIAELQEAGDRLAAQVARLDARLYEVEPSLAELAGYPPQPRANTAGAR